MAIADRQFEMVGGGAGAWMTEAVGGIVAVVLTILGLAHVAPVFLVAIALIAAGAAVVLRGAAIVRDFARLLQRAGTTTAVSEVGGSSALYVELLAGGAAIILGILSLLGVASVDLIAIGVITLGGAMVLSTNATARLTAQKLAMTSGGDEQARVVAAEIVTSSAGTQALAGLTAITLGILALAGFASVVLVLIALLTLGAFILLDGVSIGGTILTLLRTA
jgi:hypothetical protein